MQDFVSFFDSPELWKAVAFIASILLVVFPAYRACIKLVKSRAMQIADKMEEALRIRREAEEVLAKAQSKAFHQETERKQIIQSALKEAHAMKSDAALALKKDLKKKKQESLDRVRQIRQNGYTQLRDKIITSAVNTTKEIMLHSSCEKEQGAFMNASLSELEECLTVKENQDKLKSAALEN